MGRIEALPRTDRRANVAAGRSRRRWPILLLVAVLGVGLSTVLMRWVQGGQNFRIEGDFRRDSLDRVGAFRIALAHGLDAVVALESFQAAHPDELSRAEFRAFTQHHLSHKPGIRALEWIPRVTAEEREAFESSMRAEGATDTASREGLARFEITEAAVGGDIVRAGERGEYFPVTFVEPYEGNEAALGFDLGSHPVRREALERAHDAGEMLTTARIRLVQETGDAFGFLVLSPIFEPGLVMGSAATRRQPLRGYFVGVYNVGTLMDTALDGLEPRGVDVAVFDRAAPDSESLLHFHSSRLSGEPVEERPTLAGALAEPGLKFSETVRVGDRDWSVVCLPAPLYLASRQTSLPWVALLCGLGLTGLLIAYLVAVLGRERRVWSFANELLATKEELEREIAERQRSEAALRESETRFRELVKNMSSGVAVYEAVEDGEDFVFKDFNRAAETIEGVRRQELIDKRLTEVFPGVEAMGLLEVLRRVWRTGEAEDLPEAVYRDDRIEGWRQNQVYKLPSGEVVAIYDDVTERKRLEAQLLHAQKMEAVGRLAGGVAHDFNNLLQVVLGGADVLLESDGLSADNELRLREIHEQAESGARLARRLLVFSRREIQETGRYDLGESIRDAASLVGRLLKENIELRLELSSTRLPVVGDRGQIEQVLMNLVVNAADAMPDGGTLTIGSGALGEDEVWFAVADTGTGVPPEAVDKIFEPYFTTKPAARGTGLGLAVAHGVVSMLDGRIEVDNRPNEGLKLRIVLPRASASAADTRERPAVSGKDIQRGNGEKILLVEDQAAVRGMVRTMLTSIGYRVATAGSGAEARRQVVNGEFDLLLSDVVLPDVSGVELARELHEQRPALRVLLASGYTEEDVNDAAARAGWGFLSKPFKLRDLARQVREVLAGG